MKSKILVDLTLIIKTNTGSKKLNLDKTPFFLLFEESENAKTLELSLIPLNPYSQAIILSRKSDVLEREIYYCKNPRKNVPTGSI